MPYPINRIGFSNRLYFLLQDIDLIKQHLEWIAEQPPPQGTIEKAKKENSEVEYLHIQLIARSENWDWGNPWIYIVEYMYDNHKEQTMGFLGTKEYYSNEIPQPQS